VNFECWASGTWAAGSWVEGSWCPGATPAPVMQAGGWADLRRYYDDEDALIALMMEFISD